jgi:putative addiction module component (TIGR02574 family)
VTPEELLEAALQLPREDRLRIAERLFESAEDEGWPDDLHPAWRDEIASRLDKLDRGEAVLHDHVDVMREALARFAGRATTRTRRSTGTPAPGRGQGMDAERYASDDFFIVDDFDAPLPEEIQRYFDGEDDEEA